MGDVGLENFFSRPLKIYERQWALNTSFTNIILDPWTLFFTNPRVVNRISNFNLLRCKLHIKVVVNGNGFYYGRDLISYKPWPGVDEVDVSAAQAHPAIQLSQMPHIWIDPTMNKGGEMVLPFFHIHNAINIVDQGWNEMGRLIITNVVPLSHANGATTGINYAIFAWAEEVTLAVPTSVEPGSISPQAPAGSEIRPTIRAQNQAGHLQKPGVQQTKFNPSGKKKKLSPKKTNLISREDEYKRDGVISKPAATLAKVAGYLENVPILQPYAKATAMAAEGVSKLASLFGYSRPIVLEDLHPMRPQPVGDLCTYNSADNSRKLTVDIKQETTIDTRVMGLQGDDELGVADLAQRESYLTGFTWSQSDATETLLWNCEVSPVLFDHYLVNGADAYEMTPMCWISQLFHYWRGSIKYRFQVVCSSYHKGRLKIVYDPKLPTSNEYNTNYTQIVDLAETRDFEIEIGWGSEYPYLNTRLMAGFGNSVFSTLPLSTPGSNYTNGIIAVYVVNELTSPKDANDDVGIMVSVSAGDDIEFTMPDALPAQHLNLFPMVTAENQAGQLEQPKISDSVAADESQPVSATTEHSVAAILPCDDHHDDVFFGDPVVSLRQLLKRYCFVGACPVAKGIVSNTTAYYQTVLHCADFPYYKGYDPTGIHGTSTLKGFNYTQMTNLNYIVPAFAAWRGGLRHKYAISTPNYKNEVWKAVRLGPSFGGYSESYYLDALSSQTRSMQALLATQRLVHTQQGAAVTSTAINPWLEFETPYYTTRRFLPGRKLQINGNNNSYYTGHELHGASVAIEGDMPRYVERYVAAAEDFQVGFFVAVPVMYNYSYPTTV